MYNIFKRLQFFTTIFVSLFLAVFSLEEFFFSYKSLMYIAGGLAALMFILFLMWKKHLYRKVETAMFSVFFLISWISSIVAYGVSPEFFFSRFFCAWMIFLSLFYAVMVVPDCLKLIKTGAFFLSVSLLLMNVFVIANATATMFTTGSSLAEITGCFKNNRLCALGNANDMGFAAGTLIMIAVFGFLSSQSRRRAYYLVTGLVGWFTLGITGCRTCAIGVTVTIGILMMVCGIKRFCMDDKAKMIPCIIMTILIVLIASVIINESFLLPPVIYNAILKLLSGGGVSIVKSRKIMDDDGTFSSRTYIWAGSIRSFFKNHRRFFLGISPISMEQLSGAYEGHHEKLIFHAHNNFLEVFRIHGFLGFFVWVLLLVRWGFNGIKTLFDPKTETSVCYLALIAAGILIMGIAEPVPLLYTSSWPLTMLFFMVCGYFSEAEGSTK